MVRPGLLVLVAALAWAGGRKAPEGLVPAELPLAGARFQNAHLVAGAGARDLLGTFAAGDAFPVDPATLLRTDCSDHFGVVERPGASMAQAVFSAPASVAEAVGIEVDGQREFYVAWADLQPGDRWVAAIKDPSALARCCAAADAACTERYVAEVLTGQGTLYWPDGEDWRAAHKVSGPFAFRLGGNPYAGPHCGAWREVVPVAAEGTYLLGVSNATFSEETARKDAAGNALQQARVWAREHGLGDKLLGSMREERWCVESFPDAGGERWIAHVLAYLPGT